MDTLGTALEALAYSANNFVERFGLRGQVTHDQIASNIMEEASEVNRELARQNVPLAVQEYADVVYAGMSGLLSVGATHQMLIDALIAVVRKNEGKTNETHHLYKGKIQRR